MHVFGTDIYDIAEKYISKNCKVQVTKVQKVLIDKIENTFNNYFTFDVFKDDLLILSVGSFETEEQLLEEMKKSLELIK